MVPCRKTQSSLVQQQRAAEDQMVLPGNINPLAIPQRNYLEPTMVSGTRDLSALHRTMQTLKAAVIHRP